MDSFVGIMDRFILDNGLMGKSMAQEYGSLEKEMCTLANGNSVMLKVTVCI